ncbi:electron transfer flavoprotein subunit alpha/FixB family protein, partial [Erythrobacter sp. GH3-10]|nr:electron transfer flavoprotein subunit alpha/FixB family protein [Aurantiacibacter rhizosphaerae]
MTALVFAEPNGDTVADATLATVTAAAALGGPVHVLVTGSQAAGDAHGAIAGVEKVLVADDAAYADGLAENVAPLIAGLMDGYDAVL